ncbi:hypothetical protein EX30DRAFT_160003 [Ascodesmis nigricans]|uniref:C2H2-type domain-containing protein n=1 Tax=Ascodesmis nigricans TaxID=341454 RepID=A0A4S2MS68_9PEZI|nr:hypothetical protein EX30DRAFT_160003 [Ascodesmis nigricans]
MSSPCLIPTQRISRAKKGKRVHVCEYDGCDKIYTRAEHLRRHALNHSPSVTYTCEICDRTFVRHDLLARHVTRHNVQAEKAIHTLFMAERHRIFSSHFGSNGGPLPAPNGYPGGGNTSPNNLRPSHVQVHHPAHPRLSPGDMGIYTHHGIHASPDHSPSSMDEMHPQRPSEHMMRYSQIYGMTTALSSSGSSSHGYHSRDPTPSPSAHSHRHHFQFQAGVHNEQTQSRISSLPFPAPMPSETSVRRYALSQGPQSSLYPTNSETIWDNVQ